MGFRGTIHQPMGFNEIRQALGSTLRISRDKTVEKSKQKMGQKYHCSGRQFTPRKNNMEPKNHPIEKEHHLPNHHFQVPC